MIVKFIYCIFFIELQTIFCAKILFIPAHNAASHTKSMYPFAELLAAKDHEVSMLQILRSDKEKTKSKLINDIYLNLPNKGDGKKEQPHDPAMLWGTILNQPLAFYFPWYFTTSVCRDALKEPEILKQYLEVVRREWDLIIVDNLFTPCGVLATELNSEALWFDFSTTLCIPPSFNAKGAPWNSATVPGFRPDGKFRSSDFWNRFWGGFDGFVFYRIMDSMEYILPYWIDNEIATELSLKRFYSKSLLAFGSFPYELDFAHSKSTSVIEMDGACPQAKSLLEPYLSFVEDPTSKGTILFAMGHFGDWEYAPPSALQSFVDAFNELSEYRIIWQFVGNGTTPKVNKHVMLDTWIPQNEILYHKKTALFISHVGFKSFREAICSKVPIVALPMFAEQLRNGAVVEHKGVGEVLNKLFLNKVVILDRLRKVLEDSSYRTKMSKLHDSLTDRISNPLQLGVFWTDFVLKHKSYSSKFFIPKVPSTTFIAYSSFFATLMLPVFFIKFIV